MGTWLPEPVDAGADPGLSAERGEALRLAVFLLLEKLSPIERGAYILREAFDYSYRQIADVLQMGEANTRQLVSRARKHVADGRRTPVSSGEQRRLLEAFNAAAQQGEMDTLEGLFADGVVSRSSMGSCARRGSEFLAASVRAQCVRLRRNRGLKRTPKRTFHNFADNRQNQELCLV
jgi:RNA polymerase sigma-70 factor (ECF subfamily)